MTYGNPIGITLPTVGVTSDSQGEQALLNFLNAVNLVLAAKVTPAGIDINDDLSFLSGITPHGATDLLKASFTNQTATLSAGTHPVSLYTSGTDGDLYFNNAVGNQIQVTASGAVNVSSTGGVTGTGYGTGGVEINYDSVNVKYRLRSGALTDSFADVECNNVRLNDGSGNFLVFNASGSMSADYTLTFPSALPAANALLSVNAAGTITASNALSTNADITLSGTGDYKHGDKTLNIPALVGVPTAGSWVASIVNGAAASGWANPGGTDNLSIPITLKSGDRIKSVLVRLKDTAGGHSINFQLWRVTSPTSSTQLGTTQVSAGDGTNQTLTISGLTQTIAAADFIHAIILADDSTTTGHLVTGLEVTYDRP